MSPAPGSRPAPSTSHMLMFAMAAARLAPVTLHDGPGRSRVTGARALAGRVRLPRRHRYRFARNGIVIAD